jgi:hypothetical protein
MLPKCVQGLDSEPANDAACNVFAFWLFDPGGRGGGSREPRDPRAGRGGILDNPPAATKGGWRTQAAGAAATGWQYLTSIWQDCLDAFSTDESFSAGALKGLLTNDPSRGGITWLDTRYSTVGGQTVGAHDRSRDARTLKQFVGDAYARVITGTRRVVLGTDWYSDLTQTQQIANTIHEALHVQLGFGDDDLEDWLAKFGFTGPDRSRSI